MLQYGWDWEGFVVWRGGDLEANRMQGDVVIFRIWRYFFSTYFPCPYSIYNLNREEFYLHVAMSFTSTWLTSLLIHAEINELEGANV